MSDNPLNAWRARIVLALVFLVPLFYLEPRIVGVSFPDSFNFPKRYLVEVLSLLLFALCAVDLAAGGNLKITVPGIALPLLLFCSWTCITLFRAPSFHEGWTEAIRWACCGIVFLSASDSLSSPGRSRVLASCVIAAAAAVSAAAIAQFYGVDPSAFKGELHRVYSTLGNPNYIASFLAVSLPLAYWGWLCPGGGRRIAACGAVSLIGTAAILLTSSRAGAAALLAGSLAGALFARAGIARVRAACLTLSAAVLVLLLALPSPINRYDTVTVRKLAELSGERGGGAAWRLMVWRIGLRMAADHPVVGSGAGSFKLLYLPRQAEFLADPSHAADVPLAEGGIDYAHNEYLEALIETGAIGLALLVWLLWAMSSSLRRAPSPDDGRPAWVRGGAYAGSVALMTDAVVGFPLHLWPTAVVFFALCGALGTGACRPRTVRFTHRLKRIAAGIALGPVALLSLGFISFSLLAELHYAKGVSLFRRGETERACEEFARAAGWQPHHGRARFFRGLCFGARGEYAAALDELREARRTYARQALYVQEGRMLGKLGRRGEAIGALDLAHAMVLRDPDALIGKGAVLFADGNPAGAAECYRRALALAPGSYTATRNLAVACDALGKADEALRLYLRAIEIGPADANVYVNAGALLASRGETTRARELWEKALEVDPGDPRARVNLERLGTPVTGR